MHRRSRLSASKETGAIVNIQQMIGSVEVGSGLKREGNAYVLNAYGRSEATLKVNVKAGMGETKLMLSS